MAPELREWTTAGLLDYFIKIEKEMANRAFAFVLGAGASRNAGIPTGGELVSMWLGELQRQRDPAHETRTVAQWATEATTGIAGFEFARAAEFYPQIFELRFRDDPEEGYANLEAAMADREPSLGYSVLARILADTRHRVVITTNFDNLVADALSIFTKTHPLVCGHESLTGFVSARMRRPLVAKIHRDVFFAPINDTEAVARLQDGWERALRELFAHYTPVVLGYGGNDGSLMGLLDRLAPGQICGPLIWCVRQGNEPGPRIRSLVEKHRGKVVPVVGFDEFMLQLGDRLGLGFVDADIEARAHERVRRYRQAVLDIRERLGTAAAASGGENAAAADVLHAVNSTIDREIRREVRREIGREIGRDVRRETEPPRTAFSWQLKADQEPDPVEREALYRQALAAFPQHAELMAGLAKVLAPVNLDEAESLLRAAHEIDDRDPRHAADLAIFLADAGRSGGEADKLFITAVEGDPHNVDTLVRFGGFIAHFRKEPRAAERQFQRALARAPFDVAANGQYARFLAHVRRDIPGAKSHFDRLLDESGKPLSAFFAAEQASLWSALIEDTDGATRMFEQILTLFPDDAAVRARHAAFLLGQQQWVPAGAEVDLAFTLAHGHGLAHAFEIARAPLLAEIYLTKALALRIEGGDERPMLGRLKSLLGRGFGRDWWLADAMFSAATGRLAVDELALYRALYDAVRFADKAADLERHSRWRDLPAVPLDPRAEAPDKGGTGPRAMGLRTPAL